MPLSHWVTIKHATAVFILLLGVRVAGLVHLAWCLSGQRGNPDQWMREFYTPTPDEQATRREQRIGELPKKMNEAKSDDEAQTTAYNFFMGTDIETPEPTPAAPCRVIRVTNEGNQRRAAFRQDE
jgi:hypothetical protein